MRQGTIADATWIPAPRSTKNQAGKHDQERHQTREGHQWSFGKKVHLGVDQDSGLIHSVVTTAADVHESSRQQPNCSMAIREFPMAMLTRNGRQDNQDSGGDAPPSE